MNKDQFEALLEEAFRIGYEDAEEYIIETSKATKELRDKNYYGIGPDDKPNEKGIKIAQRAANARANNKAIMDDRIKRFGRIKFAAGEVKENPTSELARDNAKYAVKRAYSQNGQVVDDVNHARARKAIESIRRRALRDRFGRPAAKQAEEM